MSQQHRVVLLSAASLAIVFGKDEESSVAGEGKHTTTSASGLDIFQEFKSQNLRSFWNKRLVKAIAEVYFQGWLDSAVLLVQGSANNLEVLREAWMRRALRSPKGLAIKAVGDLSPVQMTPISQSQFIPLSEVLCSIISDMNAADVVVNQEALINHMMKAHPGMTIPTQDILYSALGTLIKERKIYHTGEGYFIVTPRTYFITNSLEKEERWWTTGENSLPSPPPITYLLSIENSVDATTPPVAHCKSCSCFHSQTTVPPSVQDQNSVSECTGKSLKWSKEQKPSVQNQSTSTAADCQASEISKSTCTTTGNRKDKPSRKFGLSLFRRNTGKNKENKPKKEYATFSGQFPPEEWPVRDEDDLNNLPRDLEHAIIKRINPQLTVDNLVRHTVLMKKLQDRGERGAERAVDKGMSTEILVSKQKRHPPKSGGKRSASRAARTKRRGPIAREKQRLKTKALQCADNLEGDDVIPSHPQPELFLDELDSHDDSTTVEAKYVYKKRIENPFQGIPIRDTTQTVGHREHRRRENKRQNSGYREHVGHRSKSWDPHRAKGASDETEKSHTLKDRSCERLQDRGLIMDSTLDPKPIGELSSNYSPLYPESCTLKMEEKVRQLRGRQVRGKECRDKHNKEVTPRIIEDGDIRGVPDQKHKASPDHPSHPYETTDAVMSWPKSTVPRRLTVCHLNIKEDSSDRPDLLASHQQTSSMASSKPALDMRCMHRSTSQVESDGYTDDDKQIYQRAEGDYDEDGCSSLCLNEDYVIGSSEVSLPGLTQCRQSLSVDGQWESKAEGNTTSAQLDHVKINPKPNVAYKWQLASNEYQAMLSISRHASSPRYEDQGVGERLQPGGLGLGTRSPTESLGLGEAVHCSALGDHEPTEAHDSSIFDYCPMSELDTDTETVQKYTNEGDSQSNHRVSALHMVDRSHGQSEAWEDEIVHPTVSESQSMPNAACSGETVESHNNTVDSGIDSPRTCLSLTSNNSAILRGLKRGGFLQNLEKLHSKSTNMHTQSSLLQLTPVMNV
ncbi:storkhead-box protein 1 [Chanos chanos]|uniref:Storkhead-box protein 1 n=1 Tax=Chanos chanos TaxID=29144 RepID=A0A6J2V637_CHACN|nr:storkhead-box protein 1 [Chanos chanos]